MANFSVEDQYSNYVIVGLDEVGRGSWAGPIVVGAVIINREFDCLGIHDSKTLSKSALHRLSMQILTQHICSIGVASIEDVNQMDINSATALAMIRAIEKLPITPTMALVDGNIKLLSDLQVVNVIRGDSISISIAAASIIAKVYRDNYMSELALEFPQYFWQNNVGYGTKKHSDQIMTHGVSVHHRLNYKPIRNFLSLAKEEV